MSGRVSAALEIAGGEVCCRNCGYRFGAADRSWKHGAALLETPMKGAGGVPYSSGEHVLLRRFSCPGCGIQLATETAMKDDPFLEDIVRPG